MWKFKWVFMIHPCCSLTVAISLFLSQSILLSALSLYIATVCSRFSSKPVHHLIFLASSDAWLAKRCIWGALMNKSAAIHFDYNQKPMQGLNTVSLRGSVITSISEVPSFQRAMINFFGAPSIRGPWSYTVGQGWVKREGQQRKDVKWWHWWFGWGIILITVIGSCCWKMWSTHAWLGGTNRKEIPTFAPVCVCLKRKGSREGKRQRWWKRKRARGSQRPSWGF